MSYHRERGHGREESRGARVVEGSAGRRGNAPVRRGARPPVPERCPAAGGPREPGRLPRRIRPAGDPAAVGPDAEPGDGALVPGSVEAEAAANALLVRAKRCGMRLARALSTAAQDAGDAGPGLRRAAEELALSSAYIRERSIFRHREQHVCDEGFILDAQATADPRAFLAGCWWLAALVAQGLEELAASIELTERQSEVWCAYVRGDSLQQIADDLGLGLGTVHAHLKRAQGKARGSWLAAYLDETRQPARR